MNDLKTIFDKYGTDKSSHGYTDVYYEAFKSLRDKPIKYLEIGVYHGQSILAFKDFFPNAEIYAIDIDDKKSFIQDRIFIEQGDQADRDFLKNVFPNVTFDIILDDGGHLMDQQFISLDELFPRLNPNGIYVLEDLHTSLWGHYNGGPDKKDTPLVFLEDISAGNQIDKSLYPDLKNIDNLLSSIQSCKVHRYNNNNSITSIIYKN